MGPGAHRLQELLRLDALRIIASLGIVALHFSGAALDRPDTGHLVAFVDLFFMISGAVLCHVYGAAMRDGADYWRFLAKRLARLLPLHWITLAGFVLIGLAVMTGGVHLNNPQMYEWGTLLPNALLVHALGFTRHVSFNGPSWSISAEMGCYLLFPAFLVIGRRPVMGLCVVAALVVALAQMSGRPWYVRTVDGGALRAAPAFLLGVWSYSQRRVLARIPGSTALLWLSLAMFGAANFVPSGLPAVLMAYMVGTLAIAGDASDRTPDPILRALAPWGGLTYSIYMAHWLVLTVAIDAIGKRVLHLSDTALVVECLALVPITAGVAAISLRLIEIPARRALTAVLLPSERRSRLAAVA